MNTDFDWYVKMSSDADWRHMGVFTLADADFPDKQTANIKGYDYIYKFDKVVDEWIDNLTFPITLGRMFEGLCSACGCQSYDDEFPNSTFIMNKQPFTAVNITGRDVLQYIAECACGFVVCDKDGFIAIKNYQIPVGGMKHLGSSDYQHYSYDIFNTPLVTSVIARQNDDDLGVESNV